MSVITLAKSALLPFSSSHSHDSWEIVLNCQGQGAMEIGDREYPYQAGTIVCQPPGLPHTKRCQGVFQDMYLQITHFPLGGQDGQTLVFQDDAEKTFETLFELGIRAFHKKERNHLLIVEALYEAMYQMLVSWNRCPQEHASVARLKKRLAENFADPELQISKLLREEPYSADHMRRLFKGATGVTPLAYLTQLRVDYACKLMQTNRAFPYSIAEISALAGFYDCGYFSRLFKQRTGCSPTGFMTGLL
jgi:AraC-like DNA-binding protein